jgi:hypothetical protein
MSAEDVKPRTTFTRIGVKAQVTALVKEARRVKYTVTTNGGFFYEVRDPENANALVFKSVALMPGRWVTTYSLAYWQEPEGGK